MKTEISRDSDRPELDYSGVFQQQGRMLTDADWNELVAIVQRQLGEALRDIVGSGTPTGRRARLAADHALVPGVVYADGRAGWLRAPDGATTAFDYKAQRHPVPALSSPPMVLRFYADVWDLPVTVLEDAGLRDPALRGADTCTRTQRVVQVKWCRPDAAPHEFPTRGTARLDLAPRGGSGGPAPGISPHLFRLEVHAVDAAGTRLTLKWSTENGALAHPTDQRLDAYYDDRHVYEFFTLDDEKKLGHVRPEWPPGDEFLARRQLVRWTHKDWQPPAKVPFVRRWDGCCTLIKPDKDGDWTLDDRWPDVEDAPPAVDGGIPLQVGVNVDFKPRRDGEPPGARVTLALELHTLTLELRDQHFLVGDHWLVAVRELGDTKPHAEDLPPGGIEHAYLDLGCLEADGKPSAVTTAETRQRRFPRLTDLNACDVAYDLEPRKGRWSQDGGKPELVQTALDELVDRKVSRSGDTIEGTLVVEADLVVGDPPERPLPHERHDALTVHGDASVSGELTVRGRTHTAGDADIQGKLVVHRDADIQGKLAVHADADVQGQLAVHADANVDGKLAVQGDVDVAGKLTARGGASVGGDAVLQGKLTLQGDAELAGTLTGKADATIAGKLTVQNGVFVRGDLWLGHGEPQRGELGRALADSPIGRNDSVLVLNNGGAWPRVEVHSPLRVRGDATIDGNLTVKGATTTVSSQDLVVTDKVVVVNRYEPADKPNSGLAGLEVFRGPDKPAQLMWDEAQRRWLVGTQDALAPVGGAQNLVTGVVTFRGIGGVSERVSQTLDPGLGIGELTVLLAVVDGAAAQPYRVGESVRPELVRWTEVNPANGTFTVHMRLTSKPPRADDLRLRWWAFMPSVKAPDLEVPAISVGIKPSGTLQLAPHELFRIEATVLNAANPGVRWSTDPTIPGLTLPTSSVVQGNAPSLPAPVTYRLRAASIEDDSKYAELEVKVLAMPILVTLAPAGTIVLHGRESLRIVATIINTSDPRLSWQVTPAIPGLPPPADNVLAGDAPVLPADQEFRVRAASVVDPTKFAETVVRVLATPILVTLAPAGPIVLAGKQPFRIEATVHNTADTRVTWSIVPKLLPLGSLPTGNVLEGNAPILDTDKEYRVRATSVAEPTKFAECVVTILHSTIEPEPEVSVRIVPAGPVVLSGGDHFDFRAIVVNAPDSDVTWKLFPTIPGFDKVTGPDFAGTVPHQSDKLEFVLMASVPGAHKSAQVKVTILPTM